MFACTSCATLSVKEQRAQHAEKMIEHYSKQKELDDKIHIQFMDMDLAVWGIEPTSSIEATFEELKKERQSLKDKYDQARDNLMAFEIEKLGSITPSDPSIKIRLELDYLICKVKLADVHVKKAELIYEHASVAHKERALMYLNLEKDYLNFCIDELSREVYIADALYKIVIETK